VKQTPALDCAAIKQVTLASPSPSPSFRRRPRRAQAMSSFSLPASAIPAWAEALPEKRLDRGWQASCRHGQRHSQHHRGLERAAAG
jgi:hypothetical protein